MVRRGGCRSVWDWSLCRGSKDIFGGCRFCGWIRQYDAARQSDTLSNQTVQPVLQSDIDVFVACLDGTEVFVCIVIGHISSRDIKLKKF